MGGGEEAFMPEGGNLAVAEKIGGKMDTKKACVWKIQCCTLFFLLG